MEKNWKIKTDALEVISYKYSTNRNNYSNIDEFQENTRNFLKWLGKKFGTLIDDFIEEIYLGDL